MRMTNNSTAPAPAATVVSFRLIEFNTHRLMRGAEAAKVSILVNGEEDNWLWMSPADCRRNIAEFGPSEVLDGVLAQYRAHGVKR